MKKKRQNNKRCKGTARSVQEETRGASGAPGAPGPVAPSPVALPVDGQPAAPDAGAKQDLKPSARPRIVTPGENSPDADGEVQSDAIAGAHRASTGAENKTAEFDETMVAHVRMVISLIEGRTVSRREIITMLGRSMRQHTLGKGADAQYSPDGVRKKPP